MGANCCHSIGGLSPTSYPIRVSVSETGDAMVIGSNASTQVCAARYDHVTGWGSKVTLQSGVYAEFPSVAMNANGDAIAAWKDIGTQMCRDGVVGAHDRSQRPDPRRCGGRHQ